MIPRFSGAILGLLAFSIATFAGLWTGNSVETTLCRALLALGLFCLLGIAIGLAAQSTIREHLRQSESQTIPSQTGVKSRSKEEGIST